MANRIFSLKCTKTTVKPLFYDLSMLSDKAKNRKNIDESEENYLAYLADEGHNNNIVTENEHDKIKLQYADNSEIVENKNWRCFDYKISRLEDVKAVMNSIHNIFNWIPGQRILNPEFGSNLYKYLYNGITTYNIEQIAAEIRQCIGKWEPRAQIEKIINVEQDNNTENNTVQFQIVYSIPELTNTTTYTYTYTQRVGT